MVEANEHINDFASFVEKSPTSYHAAAEIAKLLEQAGFTRLDEKQEFTSARGDNYVQRGGAVIAWRAPKRLAKTSSFRIVGCHTDSPALKLKSNPNLVSTGWAKLNLEIYGGMLLNSWLDRELGLAGRIFDKQGVEHLVKTEAIMRIPQLAIHLDREVNNGLVLDRQKHMEPICATAENNILKLLADLANIKTTQIGYYDIFSYVTQPPAIFGVKNEFFASGRQDNLTSVHAGVQALLDAAPSEDISVLAAFDHEEVGSQSTSGAQGTVLKDMLFRIANNLGLDMDETYAMFARSSCISSDTGHLVHPNYAEKHDKNNQPLPNQGPILKINANQRYATDALSGTIMIRACEAAGVNLQYFVSDNTVPCGTTIGPLVATNTGISTVDVGIGILSMHSAREMCGVKDPWLLMQALKAYYSGA